MLGRQPRVRDVWKLTLRSNSAISISRGSNPEQAHQLIRNSPEVLGQVGISNGHAWSCFAFWLTNSHQVVTLTGSTSNSELPLQPGNGAGEPITPVPGRRYIIKFNCRFENTTHYHYSFPAPCNMIPGNNSLTRIQYRNQNRSESIWHFHFPTNWLHCIP